jgi:hypothetical protein
MAIDGQRSVGLRAAAERASAMRRTAPPIAKSNHNYNRHLWAIAVPYIFKSPNQKVAFDGKRRIWQMSSTLSDNPQYWRDRAQEADEQAKQVTDEISKNTLLGIAQSYRFLAWRAEEKLRNSGKSE